MKDISARPPAEGVVFCSPHHAKQAKTTPLNACWGLLSRKERWGLSRRAWCTGGALTILLAFIALRYTYRFLALTDPVPAEYIAVEGWVHDHGIDAARSEYATGHYKLIFTTGGPMRGATTAAAIGAQRLLVAGLPETIVQSVPASRGARDRTYASAVALRDWMHGHHIAPTSLNVLTQDVHARRTRLLFQAAFGESVHVGIISIPNPDYDAQRWWRYSEGVRDLLGEAIAYAYAKFLFFPPREPTPAAPRST